MLTCNTLQLLCSFVPPLSLLWVMSLRSGPQCSPLLPGQEATTLSSSLHLTQTKYALDILRHSNMLECKACSSPLSSKTQLSTTSTAQLTGATEYHLLGGCPRYLTLTCPDIACVRWHSLWVLPTQITCFLLCTSFATLGLSFIPLLGCSLFMPILMQIGRVVPTLVTLWHGYCVFLGSNLVS